MTEHDAPELHDNAQEGVGRDRGRRRPEGLWGLRVQAGMSCEFISGRFKPPGPSPPAPAPSASSTRSGRRTDPTTRPTTPRRTHPT